MNKLDKQYTDLLQDIIDNGVVKQDRTGTGTISVFGRQIRHDMKEGFPLLTTKKMAWKTMVVELLWFLRGDTNIKYLIENGCHIWTGDAKKNYDKHFSEYWTAGNNPPKFNNISDEEFEKRIINDDEFAKKWGELGPIYGAQWRKWGGLQDLTDDDNPIYLDQIQNLINDLKTNPDSRRLMVNAWNVGELDQMVLPPCHYGFQVYTRELNEKERWKWLRDKFWGKGQILWDRMAIPPHKWLDEADAIYSLEQPIDFDKTIKINVPKRAISLMWNQRSVDTFLGLPFNIASYGLLLMMLADEVNMVPDQLIGNLGDVHLYSNHIEPAKEQISRKYTHEERVKMLRELMGEYKYQSAIEEQVPFGGGMSEYYEIYNIPYIKREPFKLPTVHVRDGIFCSSINDVILENYQSHPPIKAPLSN
jgi:thymidylate synthase